MSGFQFSVQQTFLGSLARNYRLHYTHKPNVLDWYPIKGRDLDTRDILPPCPIEKEILSLKIVYI